MATSCILYMIQRLVLMGLLMLKELVQSVGLVDSLGLIGEEDGVSVEGDAQLSLRDFRHLLWSEHGGRCYACIKGRGGRGERESDRGGRMSGQRCSQATAVVHLHLVCSADLLPGPLGPWMGRQTGKGWCCRPSGSRWDCFRLSCRSARWTTLQTRGEKSSVAQLLIISRSFCATFRIKNIRFKASSTSNWPSRVKEKVNVAWHRWFNEAAIQALHDKIFQYSFLPPPLLNVTDKCLLSLSIYIISVCF